MTAVESRDVAACASGFVSGVCDPSAKYKLPARHGDFYTTWSFWMCVLALCFAFVYVVAQAALGCASKPTQLRLSSLHKVLHKVLAYGIAPVALWGAANSIGVLATSQQFLGWNFTQGIVTDDSAQQNQNVFRQYDDGTQQKQLGMTLPFTDGVFKINFVEHICPGLAAFVVLLLLATGRNGPGVNRWYVVLASAICMVVFLALYLGIPAKDESGNEYFGWDKVKYVYNDPQPWMFVAQLVLTVLALVVVPTCVLNGENPWTTACKRALKL